MTNKILSKNNLLSEFNARKLSYVSNRIQIFYVDEKGFITNTCQGIWQINQKEETNFFEVFQNFELHKEAIDFLFSTKEKDGKSLSITNLEIVFEEEVFFVDVIFKTIKNESTDLFLECLVEDKTDYYISLNELKENNKLQEVEFLNEKWQLTKDTELLQVSHQKELATLDEQLRLDWTNLLASNLKKIATQNFIQSDLQNEFKSNFENLIILSNSFEKISGIRLFPQTTEAFLPKSKTISYLGDNLAHQKLIQNIVELAGGKFLEIEIQKDSEFDLEFDFSGIDFIFVEQNTTMNAQNNPIASCLLVETNFLEKEQHLINNKTNLLIYPLYPFQIWQQLLSFTNTNTMSYHEKIDLSQIYEIVDNEPMLVQSMLQILDKNLREYPAQLQQEFNDGELDTLRQTVHKFKSCTAYTGLTEFNTTLSEIEASQENGWTIAQIKDKLEFVLQAIPVIKVQVEEKLQELEKEIS